MQPYVFRLKEKGVVTDGKQESAIAIEKPYVVTEAQPSASSSSSDVVQSFFRAELRVIKDKQVH